MRAGPPGQEVHHLEDDTLIVFPTTSPEVDSQLLQLRDDLLARNAGLELALDSVPEIL